MNTEIEKTCPFCKKEKSPKRKTCWRRECQRAYHKAYQKAYNQRPEVKARNKAYYQREKLKNGEEK